MKLPELVLVHGAWHGSWAWDPLIEVLHQRGWTATAVDLPSAGSRSGIADDSAVVREALVACDGPVVVVGHSYGGYPITQAAAGVDQVIGLAYIAAARPAVGVATWTELPAPDEPAAWPWVSIDHAAGVCHILDPVAMLYHDCPPELAAAAAARLVGQSLATFLESVTAAAWQQKPSAYLICEDDRAVPVAIQAQLANGAQHIERIAASHSPFLSQPHAVEAFLRRAVDAFA